MLGPFVRFHKECLHYDPEGDKVSMLSHTYSYKPLRKIKNGHLQSAEIALAWIRIS